MSVHTYGPVIAMREDRDRFAALQERRVLIYWPHGMGDWVHLGVIAPLLEPSNAYAVTRFGDDYVSLMENNAHLQPLYSGIREPRDGSALGAAHFGLTLRQCRGNAVTLRVPQSLHRGIAAFAPDVLLWTDYPETEGRTAYPFHTKARNLARLLATPQRLAQMDLAQPLPAALDVSVSEATQRRVDERLARVRDPASKLCVVSRAGITAARKNWGDASAAAAFAAGLRRGSQPWRFVSMDDEALGDGAAGFRSLFGDLDEPFGRIFRALANRMDLFAGVPAGPLHFIVARGGIPAIGIWLAHHPDWYDEPNADAVHIVGRYVRDRGFHRRVATTTKPASLQHRLRYLDTPEIGAETVLDAVAAVM